MIKVVIFDADGVIVQSKRKFSIKLEEEHDISRDMTLPFFNGPFQDCLVGVCDLKETISPYLPVWGWDRGVDEFLDVWFKAEHKVDEELAEYVLSLREQGVLCLLGTNNEKHRFNYMLDKMGLKNIFDKTYASATLGHKKPDQEFFSKIYEELGTVNKGEILFVDDSIENIQGAGDFGFHTEFYTSMENLKKKISLLSE